MSAVVQVDGYEVERQGEVLTPGALDLVTELARKFGPTRQQLLARRAQRREALARGERLDFLDETAEVRSASWTVADTPVDLLDRRVEITGPPDRKMAVNALNSGANVWMADFEDSNAPTWRNVLAGQVNLLDAHRGRLEHVTDDGRSYVVTAGRPPSIIVRPRGWHLDERHVRVDGEPVAGALVDFALYAHANGRAPYFYLPKMESHLEARLWAEVFAFAEDAIGLDRGSIRATVLIETIPAAFEMDEILFELRDYAAGLNAGRWDYLFSIIKSFREQASTFFLPDRNTVTMTAGFMRSYTDLLVQTCHRRGAHAIGGMAAFVPNRRDPAATEVALGKVRADKDREAADGFDGSWVAHPDLVPICRAAFDAVLGDRSDQRTVTRDDVHVRPDDLLATATAGGAATRAGLENNVSVTLRYLEAWLRGSGAVAISNLMEDVATAEIARSQIWQWMAAEVVLDDGAAVTEELVASIADAELAGLEPAERSDTRRWRDARTVFDRLVSHENFVEFLTLETYGLID